MRNLRNSSKKFLRTLRRAGAVTALFAPIALGACSSGSNTTPPASTLAPQQWPAALRSVLDHTPAPATDTIEVFVCDVPLPTSDPIYGTMTLRLPLDPATIATQLERGVTPFYATLSHGAYRPHFVAGSTLTMSESDTHDACVERALDASAPTTTVVLAVASAEHLESAPGGWGRPGTPCVQAPCPASTTRRAVYVGASDFHPDNGTTPLLDLIEHEIGHTLDLPHSGDATDGHASGLDLMSNSAAPRDVQPDRKDGQDTIAIDRVALGWLPDSTIAVATDAGGRFELAPSTGTTGIRLLVLPIDAQRFLTVEYLPKTGFDDFLPVGGIAVHRIDQSTSVCEHDPSAVNNAPCTGVDRQQVTLGGPAPHLELLSTPGQTWHVEGWDVTVRQTAEGGRATMQVEVNPTDR